MGAPRTGTDGLGGQAPSGAVSTAGGCAWRSHNRREAHASDLRDNYFQVHPLLWRGACRMILRHQESPTPLLDEACLQGT